MASNVQDGVCQWAAVGSACSGEHAATTSLVLYHSRWANHAHRAWRTMRRVLQPHTGCFRVLLQEYANLTAQEDSYPAGPSRMLHRLLRSQILKDEADAFFLLESDLIPLRPLWLDALYHDALAGGRFWIRGSILLGDDLDGQIAGKLSPARQRWLADRLATNSRVLLDDQLWEPARERISNSLYSSRPPAHSLHTSRLFHTPYCLSDVRKLLVGSTSMVPHSTRFASQNSRRSSTR